MPKCLAAVLSLVLVLGGACEALPNDPSQPATLQNMTASAISVYVTERGRPAEPFTLDSGKSQPAAWRPRGPYRVEARNQTGAVIYCRIWTNEELDRSKGEIVITTGASSCP